MFETARNRRGNFVPIVNGYVIDGIEGKYEEQVIEVARLFAKEIQEMLADTHNYGLLFFACGYDCRRQQEIAQDIWNKYKVEIF